MMAPALALLRGVLLKGGGPDAAAGSLVTAAARGLRRSFAADAPRGGGDWRAAARAFWSLEACVSEEKQLEQLIAAAVHKPLLRDVIRLRARMASLKTMLGTAAPSVQALSGCHFPNKVRPPLFSLHRLQSLWL